VVISQVFTVALIAEGYVSGPFEDAGGGWAVRPLQVHERIHMDLVRAYARTIADAHVASGLATDDDEDDVLADYLALEARCTARSGREALGRAVDFLELLRRTVGFRQLGVGAPRVWVVHSRSELMLVRAYRSIPRLDHQLDGTADGVSEAAHVSAIARLIEGSPVGALLSDLFLEARVEPSADASLARLWSLLEVIAGRFPGTKLHKVRAALSRLGLEHGVDLDRVYRLRNDFVHEGRRAPDPTELGRLLDGLSMTVFAALLRTRFTVPPSSFPQFVQAPDAPVWTMRPRARQP